ncbi:MAG: endolytic transglycosylase MltG [Clostridia bacterium]|nr:endolytic transglycosylase MltG [Clostridia bacterium]
MDKGLHRLRLRKLKKLKQRRRFLFALLGILAVIFILSFSSCLKSKTVTVTIPEGTSSTKIAQILKENDVIESKYFFLARLRLSKYNGKLQYGTFKFDTNDSLGEIFEILATKGAKKNTLTLTIPEGYSAERIKARVVDMGLCTDSEFEAALKKDYDYTFLKAVPQNSNIRYRLQGFLYPSTYEFYSDATAETVIKTMLDEFQKQTKDLNIADYYKTITCASLVEREAKLDSERELISGVIHNRIKKNMPLQIDASVVYAISDGMYDVERVLYKDLEVNSQYNTYKYTGLPVGPICSPGIKSIKAALSPSAHNYLYYHTDTEKNDGSHIFTENFTDHQNTMN